MEAVDRQAADEDAEADRDGVAPGARTLRSNRVDQAPGVARGAAGR
jgi:hypothetical protein